MTPPDLDRRSDAAGRHWDSPFLKPDPAFDRPPERGAPPGVRRVLVLVVVLATAVGLWSMRASLGLGPTREVTLARPAAPTLPGDTSAAAVRADSARPASAAATLAAPIVDSAADSADALLLDPRLLVGTWHHGDARSQYGDSLVLELRADGEARSAERRYTLDRTGWHVARSSREGAWSIRYRASRPPQLCTAWRTPKVVETCEPVELLDDSADGRMLLRFAGRHWAR